MSSLAIGRIRIDWLYDNDFHLDGGAMFGVVPRILWNPKYPADENNFIPLTCRPLLVRTPEAALLVETGLGNKLNRKQCRNFGVSGPSRLEESLSALGLGREDITHVILTHLDFDHASGATWLHDDGGLSPAFPRARFVVQAAELEDALNPNLRSQHTYWADNIHPLRQAGLLDTVAGVAEVVPGVQVDLTGGHTRGHQVVRVESEGQVALHLADLMPTHAHVNPLWVMAYDNYPLDSVHNKVRWLERARREGWWLTFYHDPFLLAGRLAKGDSWEWADTLRVPGHHGVS